MAVDKVKWLQEHGRLPQFGTNINIRIDKDGNTIINAEEKIHMKSKSKSKTKRNTP